MDADDKVLMFAQHIQRLSVIKNLVARMGRRRILLYSTVVNPVDSAEKIRKDGTFTGNKKRFISR